MPGTVNVAVIYYSSTGTIARIADAMATAATEAGAHVRLRKVRELAPQTAIDSNPAWAANAEATKDLPEAEPDDMVWADAVIFGSPTRYGNVSAQLKQFIDTLGGLWAEGLLRRQGLQRLHRQQHRPRGPGVDPAGALQHRPPLRRHPGRPRLHRPVEVRRRQPVRHLARLRPG